MKEMEHLFSLACLFFFLPYSSCLKCYQCSGYDYLPATIQYQLNNFNISLDDADTNKFNGNCKSRDNYCSNATWCAKKTAEYKINFNGIKYTYHTYYKTCASNDTQTEAENAKCFNASADNAAYEGALTKTISWCYCNDKDYCNAAVSNAQNFALLIIMIIVLLN